MENFNWVDWVIVGIFVVSVLAGTFRGIIKEIISLITWIAAFIVASLFAAPLANSITNSSAAASVSKSIGMSAPQSTSILTLIVCFIGLFVITLIIGAIINYVINRAVGVTGFSIINFLLGAFFGLIRGFLINLILIFLVQLSSFQQNEAWAKSSLVRSYQPYVQGLENFVQPGFESLKAKAQQALQGIHSNSMVKQIYGAVS